MALNRTAASVVLLVALAASACSSSTKASPATTPTPSRPAGVLVLLQRDSPNATQNANLRLVATNSKVLASVDFKAPLAPYMPGCASLLPPPVRIAAGAAFYADSGGVVHRLDGDGKTSTVATFALTSSQQFLSYGVSPDGTRLMAIIFSTPPLKNPVPDFPADPFVAGGHWTLDLEFAMAGGTTAVALHKDYGTTQPSPGPTLISGWDDAGPTATLNSRICVQQAPPSLDFTGDALVHLGADGTHLDQIGGAGCLPWDELSDGTVLCGASDWAGFTVRSRSGTALWSRQSECCIYVPRLSPDGSGVATTRPTTTIYTRDSPQVASSARLSFPGGGLLGWAGSNYVLVVKQDGHIGLVPVANPQNFIDISLQATNLCLDCIPQGLALVGTIGFA